MRKYSIPAAGMPDTNQLMTDRAVFTDAYAFIPGGVMRDIVASYFPHWEKTRAWVIARPLSGFAETFSQYIMEVAPGGGSRMPEPDAGAQAAIFVTGGTLTLTIGGKQYQMEEGGYAYIPAGEAWEAANSGDTNANFHWIRKVWEPVDGLDKPDLVITSDKLVMAAEMPNSGGKWLTTRFVDPTDLRHDMHVTIVTFEPGGYIPFMETHVMEHGLFVLEGTGMYRLNNDWVRVEAGDFMWLRAFCPQGCYTEGPGRFRYLLYKDVNRHPKLWKR